LVDIEGKAADQRPDFYILTFDDWKVVVTEAQARLPRIHVDEDYQITYPHPDDWKGLNLKVEHVSQFQDHRLSQNTLRE
jgi:hypothetical protein